MIRLHTLAEGQTEEAFFNRILRPHLANTGVYADVQLLSSKRRVTKRSSKGGWNSYVKAKQHLKRWMSEDHGADCWYTTMVDLYAIPEDFPEFEACRKIVDPYERVEFLELAFYNDVKSDGLFRFVPYIQLFEFEALIFADPQKLDWEFLEHERQIAKLVEVSAQFETPELINDRPTTAPSKRIIKEIPEYEFRKTSAGPLVADKIGLPRLRDRCPHFDKWLKRLEALGA
ncbi:MAG: DUF4276 family protein [Candidatus Binatia bacterium]